MPETASLDSVLDRWAPETISTATERPAETATAGAAPDTTGPAFDRWAGAVRAAVAPCWAVDPMAAENPSVRVSVILADRAVPTAARIEDGAGVAAERALRAVANPRCHPWPEPPSEAFYNRRIALVFTPER